MAVTITDTATKFSTIGLKTGLVAYWNLDESSGSCYDSINSILATVVGTTHEAAKINNGLRFAVAADEVYAQHNAVLQISGDELSMSVWFKLDALPSTTGHNANLLVIYIDPNSHRLLIDESDNKVYFVVADANDTTYTAVSSAILEVDTWYHAVGICRGNGTDLEIYVNAVNTSNATPTFSGSLHQNTSYITIGSYFASAGIHGLLDEVGYWNKALSVSEVTALYNSGSGKAYPFT